MIKNKQKQNNYFFTKNKPLKEGLKSSYLRKQSFSALKIIPSTLENGLNLKIHL
jgi:hypothetical protein